MTGPWKPTPTDHVMIVEKPPRKPPWTSTADKIRAAEARLRDARLAELATLDQWAAQQADLEHPPPEPQRPDLVEVSGSPRAIGPDDADWIVGGWRDDGWRA